MVSLIVSTVVAISLLLSVVEPISLNARCWGKLPAVIESIDNAGKNLRFSRNIASL
jgi:hypothetical protein